MKANEEEGDSVGSLEENLKLESRLNKTQAVNGWHEESRNLRRRLTELEEQWHNNVT